MAIRDRLLVSQLCASFLSYTVSPPQYLESFTHLSTVYCFCPTLWALFVLHCEHFLSYIVSILSYTMSPQYWESFTHLSTVYYYCSTLWALYVLHYEPSSILRIFHPLVNLVLLTCVPHCEPFMSYTMSPLQFWQSVSQLVSQLCAFFVLHWAFFVLRCEPFMSYTMSPPQHW